MMVNPPAKDTSEPKELKVKVSTRMHLRLQMVKIIYGKPMQETVQEALAAYFATQTRRQGGR